MLDLRQQRHSLKTNSFLLLPMASHRADKRLRRVMALRNILLSNPQLISATLFLAAIVLCFCAPLLAKSIYVDDKSILIGQASTSIR
jgi:hypothetical protein